VAVNSPAGGGGGGTLDGDGDGDGNTASARLIIVDDIGDGKPEMDGAVPTAKMIGVRPAALIWASLVSPLSNRRVHVIVVEPLLRVQVPSVTPGVARGVTPAMERASRRYVRGATTPLTSLQMTTLL
jgi:hypothetical protein